MTQVQRAHHAGAALLSGQHGKPFTVQGFPAPFVGTWEELNDANTLEEGGFLASANAVLFVRPAEFDAVGLKPWKGMRVTLDGREMVVTERANIDYRWRLTLVQAFPKEADVPCFVPVRGTGAMGTLLFGPGNNPIQTS